jgi:hypothetical protein
MRPEICIAALILFGEPLLAGGAFADPRPSFSMTEERTIARNELLRAVVDDDPWLVRKILDMLRGSSGSKAPADPADPDFASGPRDWQATVDWNELIKRARAEKAARANSKSVSRSSEGTVEMIEWMRRLKANKAQAPQ